MSWHAYPEYIESGTSWLGALPSHWVTKPLWSMFARKKKTGFPDELMISVYREFGVILKDSRDDNLNKTAEDRDIYQLVEPGWLVTNRMKAWQGSVGISHHRGIASGHYICFEPIHSENGRYLNWLFRSSRYVTGYQTLSRGVRPGQAEIDNGDYRTLPVAIPLSGEQDAIVAFLDRETGKIDRLIAKQEQLISTLREDRTATITHAVTKGLDPDAELKDSCVQWIGPVPVGWRVTEIKLTHQVTLGKMLQAEVRCVGDTQQPYLRAAHLPPGGFTTEDAKQMWFSPAERKQLTLRKDDVVVVEGGMGGYGRCDIVPYDLTGWGFQNSINRLRPRADAVSEFTKYALQMARERGFMEALCSVSSMPHLTAEKLGEMRIPQPSSAARLM